MWHKLVQSVLKRFRQALPSTTVPVARAATGLLVALGCLSGWVVIRWIQGVPPRQEIAAHRGMYTYLLVGTVLVITWFGYALGRVEEKLRRANVQLMDMATTDDLTGLANARVFHQELPRLISLARRAGIRLSLVVLDLDHFKRLNDTYGHAAGDAALRAVGAALRSGRRREDFAARIGGEELALILPGVDPSGARAVAERIVAAVRDVRVDGAPGATVTISAGVATLSEGDSPESLFARADAALYAAKRSGRDHVEEARTSTPGLPRAARHSMA